MIVTLAGIAFPGTASDGWVLQGLQNWYRLPESKTRIEERPLHDGAFVSRTLELRRSLQFAFSATYLGSSEAEALQAVQMLRGAVARGPVELSVSDALGASSRFVSVRGIEPADHHGRSEMAVAIDLVAYDPLRYGPEQIVGPIGRPDPGPGAAFPWVYPVVYGEPGSTGRITLTNSGTADVAPWSIKVTGPLPNFSIVEVETGRRLVFSRLVGDGDVITLDPRSGRASINGQSDVTASLFVAEWPIIPAGQSRTYQFLAPSGTGQLSMSVRPAFL